jgi:hypothetical protein
VSVQREATRVVYAAAGGRVNGVREVFVREWWGDQR